MNAHDHAERVRIAIIGTGFAGLGMAIRLLQAGIDDFVVLERADDVGGTWRDNTYPGCACDVPSHLYSFSFAPNPNWTRTFSPQPEIGAYLRDCAIRFGLLPKIRFRHAVEAAEWDEAAGRWLVTTAGGRFSAQFVVSATGALSEPAVPAIPGLDTFQGAMFHTARWDHDHDLTGERVAVIGTGASSIQVVPAIQPAVARLDVYQRTPPWIMPHPDRAITASERTLYRLLPPAQHLVRAAIYWGRETLVYGFAINPRIMRAGQRRALRHLHGQVNDPVLRAKLTPRYELGCKRVLLSNTYYPALTQPNVDLITDGIAEVTPTGIVTADGTTREVDTIVLGTGFHVTDNPAWAGIRGRDGRTLAEVFTPSMRGYLGTAVPGFPNLFTMTGPNTGLGHTSMVFMIESQLNYVLDALRTLDERGAGVFDVRPEVVDAFNRELDERTGHTVWSSGCASWYLDAAGRNSTLWPGFTWEYRRRTRHFDPAAYRLTPSPERHGELIST